VAPHPEAAVKCLPVAALVDALGVGHGDLVSLVGGGGKTTLMYRLVAELHGAGLRAAAATTTKIGPPTPDDPCTLLLAADYESLLAALHSSQGPAVLGRSLVQPQKVAGIPAPWCDRLLVDRELDCLVVEADGAARKPLKAPAAWEPVVPETTRLFVVVVGLSCLGSPLDALHVFRPERVAEVTGMTEGSLITAETVARLLVAPDGLAKGCPATARTALVLNQADTEAQVEAAQEIAEAIGGEFYQRVLIASLGREREVRRFRP